jgi:hypothetical protein
MTDTFVPIRTMTGRRQYRRSDVGLDVHRDCGIGCTCAATIFTRGNPSIEMAEAKTLCFNDRLRQGISEVKSSGRALKEGPDEWIYEVAIELLEARP